MIVSLQDFEKQNLHKIFPNIMHPPTHTGLLSLLTIHTTKWFSRLWCSIEFLRSSHWFYLNSIVSIFLSSLIFWLYNSELLIGEIQAQTKHLSQVNTTKHLYNFKKQTTTQILLFTYCIDETIYQPKWEHFFLNLTLLIE